MYDVHKLGVIRLYLERSTVQMQKFGKILHVVYLYLNRKIMDTKPKQKKGGQQLELGHFAASELCRGNYTFL